MVAVFCLAGSGRGPEAFISARRTHDSHSELWIMGSLVVGLSLLGDMKGCPRFCLCTVGILSLLYSCLCTTHGSKWSLLVAVD